ncbi:glycosyltransferase family 2 protein [Prauserella endophytica]|uniref:Glycosyltransferase n=1 Tax=Prauserella endophytica TaxID=1592324 RepID=A0ABY2RSM9_9PSEU|nr:glycosyltransferase family 2 protein [Prauserella endophytica]TKG58718.1 glycosyltransferase [Prauserella endophytica]
MPRTPTPPPVRTAPVLAILVCHNGEDWLPLTLSALRRSTIRPRHVLAVDTGSTDGTAALLEAAAAQNPESADGAAGPPVLDGVITLPDTTGFASAVAEAVTRASERWGDPGQWIWLLHDDSAPEPDCLDLLLRAAETAPSAGVLGPLAVDWADPRLIVEAGLSTDASGHRQPAVPRGLGDEESPEQSTEVLAVPSAGSLIRRTTWEELDGFDREIALLREDIDFGWRVNAAGGLVLCVPVARLRHVRAAGAGRRQPSALPGTFAGIEEADRVYGLRTFLVNCSTVSCVLGLPRLVLLCVLRGLGFALLRNGIRARAEFAAAGYLLGGTGRLRAARAARRHGTVRGMLTSRFARLRGALRGGVVHLVRRRVASEAALGRLPETAADDTTAWIPPEVRYSRPVPVGPDALPAGATRALRSRATGLRRPADVVAVPLPEPEPAEPEQETAQPSPGGEAAERELVFVEVDRRRILAATLFAPPVVLLVVLTALALVLNGGRLGLDLAGGSLLPVGDLAQTWATYLDSWHAVAGGTASAAPVALPVLGLLGAPLAPLGGPAALVSLLLIADIPLAALVAYAATRRLRVDRWVRAGAAAAYALLPAATASVAQGRIDVVVVHILLPALIAGVVAVLTRADARWLSTSVLCALTLAVVGAFSPLAHGLALVALVLGFVVLPPPGKRPARGVPAVAIVVLLPLVLLLPWLPTLLTNPSLLLHGLGAPAPFAAGADLAGLDPGGPGGFPFGLVVVVAALAAAVVRPTARVVPGLAVLVLGVVGTGVTQLVEFAPPRGGEPAPAFAGVPLLVAGAGLLLVVLGTCAGGLGTAPRALARVGALGGVAVLLTLAAGGVATGREGSVRAGGGWTLASSLTQELADTGRGVLVLAGPGEPVRQSGGRLPAYGDDALVPVPGTPERLDAWQRDLLGGSREAVTSAAAAGVLFVVLPPGEEGARLRQAASDLVRDAPTTSDGRVVLRLTPVSGQVTLVSPEQARRAVSGEPPSGELMTGSSVAEVEARLPDVRVRVSDGPDGRLLVLAAEQEAGWRATVNGEPVPIVPAWGHQVAVSVPPRQSEVTVEYSPALHNVLLLVQVAALLFTVLTAIPGRRGPHSPSMMSGSTPR